MIIAPGIGMTTRHIFMGELYIRVGTHILVITPTQIVFNKKPFVWIDETPFLIGHLRVQTSDNGQLLRITTRRVSIVVRRHLQSKTKFLNIEIEEDNGLSRQSSGLLGKFTLFSLHFKRL